MDSKRAEEGKRKANERPPWQKRRRRRLLKEGRGNDKAKLHDGTRELRVDSRWLASSQVERKWCCQRGTIERTSEQSGGTSRHDGRIEPTVKNSRGLELEAPAAYVISRGPSERARQTRKSCRLASSASASASSSTTSREQRKRPALASIPAAAALAAVTALAAVVASARH